MPPIFKALITISVWVLFIKGWLATVMSFLLVGQANMAGTTPPMVVMAMSGVGVAALILACVAAKIRKGLE